MAPMLSSGWEADCRCGAGSGSRRSELSLCFVSVVSGSIQLHTDDDSYDPDFEQWEFGKLSAMREIAFAVENGYPYYYMG